MVLKIVRSSSPDAKFDLPMAQQCTSAALLRSNTGMQRCTPDVSARADVKVVP